MATMEATQFSTHSGNMVGKEHPNGMNYVLAVKYEEKIVQNNINSLSEMKLRHFINKYH